MGERGGGQRLVWLLIAALVGALTAAALVTVTSSFIPSYDDSYGAPIAVGRSCFELFFPRCDTTFSWPLFAVDVFLNWLLWFALARWSGVLGVAAGIGGSLVSILLIPVMLSYQLQIVGLPIPLGARTPIPNAFGIWLDVLFWAAAAAALSRIVRTRWIARAT
jgi:hypothetical protein